MTDAFITTGFVMEFQQNMSTGVINKVSLREKGVVLSLAPPADDMKKHWQGV